MFNCILNEYVPWTFNIKGSNPFLSILYFLQTDQLYLPLLKKSINKVLNPFQNMWFICKYYSIKSRVITRTLLFKNLLQYIFCTVFLLDSSPLSWPCLWPDILIIWLINVWHFFNKYKYSTFHNTQVNLTPSCNLISFFLNIEKSIEWEFIIYKCRFK